MKALKLPKIKNIFKDALYKRRILLYNNTEIGKPSMSAYKYIPFSVVGATHLQIKP